MYEHESVRVKMVATLMELVGSMIIVYFVVVTFGARLIDDLYENLLYSLLISCLCFMPAFVLIPHRSPIELVDRLVFKNQPQTRLEENLIAIGKAAIVGGWSGALVIPLDWDRWWQQWPISCTFGSLLAVFGVIIYKLLLNAKPSSKVHL